MRSREGVKQLIYACMHAVSSSQLLQNVVFGRLKVTSCSQLIKSHVNEIVCTQFLGLKQCKLREVWSTKFWRCEGPFLHSERITQSDLGGQLG